jgi:hypothetical protein
MTTQMRVTLLVLQVVAIALGIWLGSIVWTAVS